MLSEPDAPLLEYAGYGSDFDLRVFTSRARINAIVRRRLELAPLSDQLAAALVQTPQSTVLPTDEYNLFNLNASFSLNDRLRLRGGIDNLFDEDPPLTGRQSVSSDATDERDGQHGPRQL